MKKKILFTIFLLVYFFHLGIKFSFIKIDFRFPDWWNNYLADLICMPILLSFCLIFIKKVKKNENFTFSWQQVFFQFLYTSIVFEYILPQISNRYTADTNDVLMYAFGSLFFYFFLNQN